MDKTEKITFRASEQLKSELVHIAELQGISTGQLIRNLIDVIINNQVINSPKHIYQLQDGTQFPDMKSMCKELQISSLTARKRVKKGVIKKITLNPYQTKQYGEEISTTRSRRTESNRFSV